MSEEPQEMEEQLDRWRAKLDELKLKAHLLGMEYRDTHDEVVEGLEKAYDAAKEKLVELKDATSEEAGQLKSAFRAAWGAFREAYGKATEGGEEA